MQPKTCIACSYLKIAMPLVIPMCRLTGKAIKDINGLSSDCPTKGK
jgi:hypothetical protein